MLAFSVSINNLSHLFIAQNATPLTFYGQKASYLHSKSNMVYNILKIINFSSGTLHKYTLYFCCCLSYEILMRLLKCSIYGPCNKAHNSCRRPREAVFSECLPPATTRNECRHFTTILRGCQNPFVCEGMAFCHTQFNNVLVTRKIILRSFAIPLTFSLLARIPQICTYSAALVCMRNLLLFPLTAKM